MNDPPDSAPANSADPIPPEPPSVESFEPVSVEIVEVQRESHPLDYAPRPERVMIEQIDPDDLEPEHPLHYARPAEYDPVRLPFGWPPAGHFFAGMAVGLVLSAFVWLTASGLKTTADQWMSLVVVVLGIKIAIGVTGLAFTPWRMAGAGMLTSIALGTLICGVGLVRSACGEPLM